MLSSAVRIAPVGNSADREAFATTAVVGKTFPTNLYAVLIARFPLVALVLSTLLPLGIIFAAIGQSFVVDSSKGPFTAAYDVNVQKTAALTGASSVWSLIQNDQRAGPWSSNPANADLSPKSTLAAAANSIPKLRVTLIYTPKPAVLSDNVQQRASAVFPAMTPELTADTVTAAAPYLKALAQASQSLLANATGSLLRHRSALGALKDFEARTIALNPDAQRLCWKVARKAVGTNFGSKFQDSPNVTAACAPVNSIAQYYFPGRLILPPTTLTSTNVDPIRGFVEMDGLGKAAPTTDVTLTWQRMLLNPRIHWYTSDAFTAETPTTDVLRTQVVFGYPVLGPSGKPISDGEYYRLADNAIRNIVAAARNESLRNPYLNVYVGGDRVVDVQVASAMDFEIYKAPVAGIIIVILMWVRTRSIVASILAVFQLLLCYLSATSLYTFSPAFSGRMPLLTFLGIFLAVMFGIDGIASFHDAFIHSGVMTTTGRRNHLTVAQRLSFTMRKTLKGVFVSHGVALVAIACTTYSSIPAVRDFAYFIIA